jgi:hypothetical protein
MSMRALGGCHEATGAGADVGVRDMKVPTMQPAWLGKGGGGALRMVLAADPSPPSGRFNHHRIVEVARNYRLFFSKTTVGEKTLYRAKTLHHETLPINFEHL